MKLTEHFSKPYFKQFQEGLMDVNRKLVEAASSAGLPLKLTGKPGRVTPDQLKNTLNLFR